MENGTGCPQNIADIAAGKVEKPAEKKEAKKPVKESAKKEK